MAVVAKHDPPQERNRQRCPPRKRFMAHLVETKKRPQNRHSRDAQLVSSFPLILGIVGWM